MQLFFRFQEVHGVRGFTAGRTEYFNPRKTYISFMVFYCILLLNPGWEKSIFECFGNTHYYYIKYFTYKNTREMRQEKKKKYIKYFDISRRKDFKPLVYSIFNT